jgi:pimeloyl-ACP methyl ester carboxylesterase
MGWTVIAPYLLNKCDYVDDFDGLGAISSGSTLYGYEIEKMQSIVDYVSNQERIDEIDVYGISFGGQIAMLLAALDTRYQNLIVSGAMIYDYHHFYRDYILNKEGEARVGGFLALISYLEVDELLLDFLEDGGNKLAIEVGAYDIQKQPELDNRETIARFLGACSQAFEDCEDRVFINFFRGYHEANPQPSLQFILP